MWVSPSLLQSWQVMFSVIPARDSLSRDLRRFWEANQRVKDCRGRCPLYHINPWLGLLAFLFRSFSQAEAILKVPLAWCFHMTCSSSGVLGGGGIMFQIACSLSPLEGNIQSPLLMTSATVACHLRPVWERSRGETRSLILCPPGSQ